MTTPEDRILNAADPIKDHALLYYLRAYQSVKYQLDQVASALESRISYPDTGPVLLDGPALRKVIKRIMQLDG